MNLLDYELLGVEESRLICLLARTGKELQSRHVQEPDVAHHQVSTLDIILSLLYYLKWPCVRRRELCRSGHIWIPLEEHKVTWLVTIL